jgi:hypothetical protein
MSKTNQKVEIVSKQATEGKKPTKPYKTPQLVVYGKLAELTEGIGGSKFDPGHTSNSRVG